MWWDPHKVTLLATRSYKNVTGLPAEVELHEVHGMQVRTKATNMKKAAHYISLFAQHRVP
jgi:hypothetical protein